MSTTPIDNGGPAFPRVEPLGSKNQSTGEYFSHESDPYVGMSLRDYFAARAMQSFLEDSCEAWVGSIVKGNKLNLSLDDYSKAAYAVADAMLRARKSGGAA